MDFDTYISATIIAALEAGKAIIKVYESDFSVEYKADSSPLTLADKQAHTIIKEYLTTGDDVFPVLSEEGRCIPFEERKNWEMLWIVDPLDGTKEFVNRNGEFTVNIALIQKTKPVLGVIYSPVLDKLYFGCKGKGAYVITEASNRFSSISGVKEIPIETIIEYAQKLPIKNKKGNNTTLTIIASRSHFSGETEEYVNSLKESYSNIELISAGSSLKMCLIAEGKAHIYPRFAPTMEWDTAAGQAIVEASGGRVVLHDSEEKLAYNKENLLNPWFIVKTKGCTCR
ncbi:MAG: 3'(2'),5'-bisphosphate nucleotidase CysQ [Spirochaetales bacterium]|nr:3'(2'),5'-bisphosphate nucleotidase CysQ [Spirochaetales bacterium]